MAKERALKEGLEFFPLDVDFFSDTKILLIESKFGFSGSIVATRLLCSIYRNGYFIKWNDGEALAVARLTGNGVTWEVVNQIVTGLIDCDFFDRGMFEAFGILTSRGIQKRWLKIIDDCNRKARIKSDFDLTMNNQKSDLLPQKSEESPQSKVKESRVEEIKVEESKVDDAHDPLDGKNEELVNAICENFEVKKITLSPKYNLVCEFVDCVSNQGELDTASNVLEKYKAYKARSQEQKHGVKTWLGTKENHFRDGEWIAIDWDLKLKNYERNGDKQHQGTPPAASATITPGRGFGDLRTYRAKRDGSQKSP